MTSRSLPVLAVGLLTLALAGCGPDTLIGGVMNPFRYGLCGLVVIVLDVIALVDLLNSTRTSTEKLLWALGIIVFPFVGLLAYYLVGRR